MTQEFAQRATRGAGWNYLSFGLSKVLSLVIVSVLAHILSPENFGVVALATLAIDYLSIFNDFGLGAALIQRRESVEISANIVFTMNLIIGTTLTFLTFLIAPQISVFFKEASLIPILRWLGFSFLINAIGSVHKARLQRDLNFRLKIVPELGNVVSKGVLSISLAFAGFGVWALVYGQLIGTCVATILLWMVVPWRPHLDLETRIAKELLKYGLPVMSESALSVFGDSFDYFLIGRLFDPTLLGIYTLAYRLPEMLVINTLWVLAAVIFPAFSSIQTQTKELQKSFLATIKYVQLLVTPISFGLLIAADPIIRVVFGEQWLGSISIMRILSTYVLVVSIGFHVGDVYKAIGRPDILIKLSLPVFIIRILAIWIGAQYSLIGVALGHLIAAIIELILRMIVTIRIVKVSIKEIVSQLTSFIGGFALLTFAIPTLYLTSGSSSLIQLISVIITGATGYISVIWLLERKTLKNIYKIILQRPQKAY